MLVGITESKSYFLILYSRTIIYCNVKLHKDNYYFKVLIVLRVFGKALGAPESQSANHANYTQKFRFVSYEKLIP